MCFYKCSSSLLTNTYAYTWQELEEAAAAAARAFNEDEAELEARNNSNRNDVEAEEPSHSQAERPGYRPPARPPSLGRPARHQHEQMRQQQQQQQQQSAPLNNGVSANPNAKASHEKRGGGALEEAVGARRGDLHEANKRARKQPGFLGGLDDRQAAERVRQMTSSKQRSSDPHLLELQSATDMAAADPPPPPVQYTPDSAAAFSQPQPENDALLRQLQENYNRLLTKYALAEVTIDQLRLSRPRAAPQPAANRMRDVFTLRQHRFGGGGGPGAGGAGGPGVGGAGADPFNRPFASGRRPWGQQSQFGAGDGLTEGAARSEQDLFYDVGGGLGPMDSRYPAEMGGSALLLEAPPSPPPVAQRRPYSVLEEPNLERCTDTAY